MSVAAPSPTETKSSSGPVSLWTTGLAGAIYVLASMAVVFYGVPQLWDIGVSSWLTPAIGATFNGALRLVAQIAAVVGLAIFGINLAGPNPPVGMRGSVFLGIATILTAFFLGRGLLMTPERMTAKFEIGQIFSLVIFCVMAFFFYKFLASDRFQRWSIALENSGWFSGNSYKRNQGIRVRRFTIMGVLLLFGSGIYTLVHNNIVTVHDLTVSLPFTKGTLIILPDAHITVPVFLVALALWFAWRVVNYPVFADFLIATEAEINKVSWTPRARLLQDTIVVLVTLVIITMFLFIVDVFWGWILSREIVGILPSEAETKPKIEKQVNTNEW